MSSLSITKLANGRHTGLVLHSFIAIFQGSNITKYSGLNTEAKYLNRQNIVKIFGKSFPTVWHNATLKNLGQSGARKLQMLLLSKNARWLHESGLESITLDANSTVKSVCGNQEGAAKGFNTTKKRQKATIHSWFL